MNQRKTVWIRSIVKDRERSVGQLGFCYCLSQHYDTFLHLELAVSSSGNNKGISQHVMSIVGGFYFNHMIRDCVCPVDNSVSPQNNKVSMRPEANSVKGFHVPFHCPWNADTDPQYGSQTLNVSMTEIFLNVSEYWKAWRLGWSPLKNVYVFEIIWLNSYMKEQ